MTFILCPFPLSSINKISSAIGSKKLESQMRLRTLIQHLFCTGDSNSGNFSAWPPTGQHPWDSVSFFFFIQWAAHKKLPGSCCPVRAAGQRLLCRRGTEGRRGGQFPATRRRHQPPLVLPWHMPRPGLSWGIRLDTGAACGWGWPWGTGFNLGLLSVCAVGPGRAWLHCGIALVAYKPAHGLEKRTSMPCLPWAQPELSVDSKSLHETRINAMIDKILEHNYTY